MKPTVGRIVWYYQYDPGLSAKAQCHLGPFPAIVTLAPNDNHLCLTIFAPSGSAVLFADYYADPADHSGRPLADFWCWPEGSPAAREAGKK